jgi:hypothetical protein
LVPLVQCTANHFNFNSDLLLLYSKFNLNYSLCPPIDYTFEIGGRVTSNVYKQFSVNIQACNNAINPKCASSAYISGLLSAMGSFTLAVPVVNTIVNANDQEYMQIYIEDRNYYYFTTSYGVRVAASIEQNEINTDTSIMPYSVSKIEYITTIPNLFTSQNVEVGPNNLYAQVSFSKSSSTTVYSRSFNKIDSFFSYIGGLLGSALAIFFLLKSYSEMSFLIELA